MCPQSLTGTDLGESNGKDSSPLVIKKHRLLVLALLLLSGCAGHQPSNVNDLCDVLGDEDWYSAALESQENWGTPIHVQLAIMHQESKFVEDARPPRTRYLGFIPGPRPSSAYGYSQALDEVWREYQDGTGNSGADRDDFADSIDFIGWYTARSHARLGISKWDAKLQYLAYHEGTGGYSRGTYRNKPWLLKVADKVKRQSLRYAGQLRRCQSRLDALDDWW